MLVFSINLTQTKDLLWLLLWLLACCNGFMVLGCALWLSVLAFFDFQMLCYLAHDPSGVRSQKGKWLIDSELGGCKVALVDAW